MSLRASSVYNGPGVLRRFAAFMAEHRPEVRGAAGVGRPLGRVQQGVAGGPDGTDLRHVVSTMAAATGAGIKELMYRLGHVSPHAALRYQHATRERDTAVAEAMGAMIRAARTGSTAPVGGGTEARTRPGVTQEGHAGSFEQLGAASKRRDQGFRESGRRESNPRSQLGKLMFCR